MGRLVLVTLEDAGFACSTTTTDRTASRQGAAFADRISAVDADINVVCVNADRIAEFARFVGPEFFRGRYTIGYWAWETENFPPSFDEAFQYVDEVWALSAFTAKAIAKRSPVPVRVAPLPVVHRPSSPVSTERPKFLFSFDFLSVIGRKNPLGLVEAFRRAFEPDEGPELILKSINGDLRRADVQRISDAIGDRSDIRLMDGYLDEVDRDALMEKATAYVSLHRAEGFGLTIAEAMARGIPAIATAYSGNLDFSLPNDPFGVPFERVAVGDGNEPYPPDDVWAEPDLDEAARMMRLVFDSPDEAVSIARAAQAHVREHHSVAARSALFADLIADAETRPRRVSDVIDDLLSETVSAMALRRIKDLLRPMVHAIRRLR